MPNKKIILLILISLITLARTESQLPPSTRETRTESQLPPSTKKIPAPKISTPEIYASPGSIINIQGAGFIKNFPQGHILRFSSLENNSSFRGRVISASSNLLTLETPLDIGFGDYRSRLRLKSRYLKSDLSVESVSLKLRPPAPQKPQQIFQVASYPQEIPELFKDLNQLEIIQTDNLKPGINTVKFSYRVNGFLSLPSEALSFFYLPQDLTKPELEIASTQPLRSYALSTGEFKQDVSSITKTQTDSPLITHYYLSSPHNPNYLLTTISLKPVYISAAKATTPEYVLIKNRDNKNYDLSNCTLTDDLKIRYLFGNNFTLKAGEEFNVEGILSLNDDGDTVTVTCPKLLIDKFAYKIIDSLGFGIQLIP